MEPPLDANQGHTQSLLLSHVLLVVGREESYSRECSPRVWESWTNAYVHYLNQLENLSSGILLENWGINFWESDNYDRKPQAHLSN